MIFYLLLIGIILVPILMLLPALRNKRTLIEPNRDAENINIARQRMQEVVKLKDEEQRLFQEARLELQATLLEDLHTKNTVATNTAAFNPWGVAIVVLIPLMSLALYGYLGAPKFADPVALLSAKNTITQQSDNPLEITELLILLEEKLAQNPDNAAGWELAATTYMKLGEYKKATVAYEKLNMLVVGNADFLVAWADAEILLNGNIYIPAAKHKIEKALAINPQHINGLWIAGLGANSLGEYAQSLGYLNTLMALVADDPKSTANIERLIARIRTQTGNLDVDNRADKPPQQTATTNNRVIRVAVMLADNLLALADENDVVFVFAKAVDGPAIPLAVSKYRVKELPIEITLTENMAMLPNMTIASFDKITVTARVSKTGKPIQQPGDLVSDTLITEHSRNSTVKLIIDRIAK